MIQAAKEVGYSPTTFSEKLKLEESLLDRIRKLKGEIEKKESEVEEMKGLVQEVTKTKGELAKLEAKKKQLEFEVEGVRKKLEEYNAAVAKVDTSLGTSRRRWMMISR